MTVSSAVRKAGPYTGNGAQTVYPFAFKIYTKTDIEVITADVNGLETTLVVDSGYRVTINADQDDNPGGYVTLTTALTLNYSLVILGNLPDQQLTDLTNLGGFFPQTVEDMDDRNTILIQQLEEKVGRSVQVPVTSTLDPADLVDTIVAAGTAATNFFGVYYGAYPSNPSVDPLGNPPNSGDLYYNTVTHLLMVYDAALLTWTTQPSGASMTGNVFSGTGAQVNFTLSTTPYTISNLLVYVGGVAQRPTTDYTVAGTTLTFVVAPPNAANNVLVFVLNSALIGSIDGANIFNTVASTKIKYVQSAAEAVAGITPADYSWLHGDIRRYGATTSASAATNDTAINSSIAQAKQSGGSTVRIEDGQYTVGGAALIDSYAGNELLIIGKNAGLVVGANLACLTITNSENVTIKDLQFSSAAASGLSQRGVYLNNCGRIRITGNDFRTLTYGVYVGPTKTGLATGAFPIPVLISQNNIKACGAGVYCAPTGEYVNIAENTINDCTLFGVAVDAGNIAIVGNTISGNDVGVKVDGSGTTNGDHGSIVNNAINHNSKANVVISSTDYSMLISGNNIWAAIASNYGGAPYNTSFGMLLLNAFNIECVGNVFGNSIVNIGGTTVTSSNFAHNVFISDNARTTANILDTDATLVTSNFWGHNTYSGTLLAGANNNDTEQIYLIGAAGQPAFQNAWVNFGVPFADAGYWRDGENIVHLRGIVKTGTIAALMFTLPVGYRPANNKVLPTISNDLFAKVTIASTGDVTPNSGTNAYFVLDGLSFRAGA